MKSVDLFVSFLVFIAVMASAAIVPNMLERGRADYYLSKPISRRSLFLAKLASVWAVYGGMILLAALLVFGTIALVHQLFDAKVLWLLGVAGLSLLVWLAITFTAGVFTGSTSWSVVTAFLIWIFQVVLGSREGLKMFFNSEWVSRAIDGAYYVFPKPGEMSAIGLTLATGQPVESWMPIWTSLLFAITIVAGTLVWFARKDY